MNHCTETGMNPNIGTNESRVSLENKPPNHKKLPLFLLSNIQSFGNSEDTDKTTEIETVLDLNQVDVACLTET